MALNSKLFSRLVFFVALVIPIFFGFYLDINRPYHFLSDTDLAIIGEALAVNSNLSQTYFDHPSFTVYLGLAWYLKFLNFLGFQEIFDYKTLYQVQNTAIAMTDLVYHARIYGFLVCDLTLLAFYFLCKNLTKSSLISAVSCLLFASTEGILLQSIMIRMEPMSIMFSFLCLAYAIKWARFELRDEVRLFYFLFVASIFFYLAAITKILCVIILFLLLPVVLIFQIRKLEIGKDSFSKINWKIFILFVPAVATLVILTIDVLSRKNLISYAGYVGFFIVVQILLSYKKLSKKLIFQANLAILFGLSTAVQINSLYFDIKNHYLVVNYYERGKDFSTYDADVSKLTTSVELLKPFFYNLERFTSVKFYSRYLIENPILFLFSLVLIQSILVFPRNRKKSIELISYLFTFITIEAFLGLRYQSSFIPLTVVYYKTYTYPVLILGYAQTLQFNLKNSNASRYLFIFLIFLSLFVASISYQRSEFNIKENQLFRLPLDQPPACACSRTMGLSRHLYQYLVRNNKNCVNVVLSDLKSMIVSSSLNATPNKK